MKTTKNGNKLSKIW